MYESILIPLDGSLYAESALRHVSGHEPNARRLTLVRVIHTFEELYGTRQPDPLDTMEQTEDLLTKTAYDEEHAEARHYLDRIQTVVAEGGMAVQTVVVEGDPASETLGVAAQVQADLIVITSHGLSASSSPTKTGVFGKVADSILRQAHAPVLVIKPFHTKSS